MIVSKKEKKNIWGLRRVWRVSNPLLLPLLLSLWWWCQWWLLLLSLSSRSNLVDARWIVVDVHVCCLLVLVVDALGTVMWCNNASTTNNITTGSIVTTTAVTTGLRRVSDVRARAWASRNRAGLARARLVTQRVIVSHRTRVTLWGKKKR